jgi:hypothetical protein
VRSVLPRMGLERERTPPAPQQSEKAMPQRPILGVAGHLMEASIPFVEERRARTAIARRERGGIVCELPNQAD